MKSLAKKFINYPKDLKSSVVDLITFTKDLEAMKHGIENDEPYSRQTVEPMTRLRVSKEDVEAALADPDGQFIKDRLCDITGI